LVENHGVRTIDDLFKLEEGVLNSNQQIGLKYYCHLKERIPRAEITQAVKLIKSVAKEIDPKIIIKCCGSYRRKLPTSGDIDILVTHPEFNSIDNDSLKIMEKILVKLQKTKFIVQDLNRGPVKYTGICKIIEMYRHLDIKLVPIESFYCALIHSTGSGEHNRKLRVVSQAKGYKLNEYGLYPIGKTGVVGVFFQFLYLVKKMFSIF